MVHINTDVYQALTVLRSLNVALAITNNPGVMVLAVLYVLREQLLFPFSFWALLILSISILFGSFVWAMTTLVLNRSLLHVRRVEVSEAFAIEWPQVGVTDIRNLSTSSFELPPKRRNDWELEEEIKGRGLEIPWENTPSNLQQRTPLAKELRKYIH
jgi:hypothetical protein